MKRHHSLWCNCAECVCWRGCRVPDSRVEALEATFSSNDPLRRFVIPPNAPLASDEQLRADITSSTKFVPWWEMVLTTRDVAFLKEMRIDPWK